MINTNKLYNMKRVLVFLIVLFSVTIYSQEYKIKKAFSPQFGKIPTGKTNIIVSDSIITVKVNSKTVEYKIVEKEEVLGNTIYISKMGSQNDVRFTVFMNEKFIRFENKDSFSGKVSEINYFF